MLANPLPAEITAGSFSFIMESAFSQQSSLGRGVLVSASLLIVSGNSLSIDGQEFKDYSNWISKILIEEFSQHLEYLLSPVCRTVLSEVKECSYALVGKPRHR